MGVRMASPHNLRMRVRAASSVTTLFVRHCQSTHRGLPYILGLNVGSHDIRVVSIVVQIPSRLGIHKRFFLHCKLAEAQLRSCDFL